MITRIDVTLIEESICNPANNSWCYEEMILDRRQLNFTPRYSIPLSIYESLQFDMHFRFINDVQHFIRLLTNEIT